jgi:hypothetical protein
MSENIESSLRKAAHKHGTVGAYHTLLMSQVDHPKSLGPIYEDFGD